MDRSSVLVQFAVTYPSTVARVHESPGRREERAKCEELRQEKIENLDKRVAACEKKWIKTMGVMKNNTRSACGETGTSCYRAPEVVEASYMLQMEKDREKRRAIRQKMTEREFAEKGDVYSAGLYLLSLTVVRPLRDIARQHIQTLASKGRVALGPEHQEKKRGPNKYGEDNGLRDWVDTVIIKEHNFRTIVRDLRSVRGLPDVTTRPRGEGGHKWTRTMQEWKKLVAVLKGLLEPRQCHRWTASFALTFIKGVGKAE
jgi:hypothetical protein